jgi:hypothetical protein
MKEIHVISLVQTNADSDHNCLSADAVPIQSDGMSSQPF